MKIYLSVLFLIFYYVSFSQIDIDLSTNLVSETSVDTINLYFNKALNSEGREKLKYEKLFLESLPDKHYEMCHSMDIDLRKKVIEWKNNRDNENYGPKLYIVSPWVEYLSNMDYYDKEAYYKKYFNICIGGEYGADYMRSGFEIYKRFLIDTEIACRELKKLNDKEIASIFYFIFDETHPKHNEENIALYNKMLTIIKKNDIRLSKLLEKSYNQIIKEQSQH